MPPGLGHHSSGDESRLGAWRERALLPLRKELRQSLSRAGITRADAILDIQIHPFSREQFRWRCHATYSRERAMNLPDPYCKRGRASLQDIRSLNLENIAAFDGIDPVPTLSA